MFTRWMYSKTNRSPLLPQQRVAWHCVTTRLNRLKHLVHRFSIAFGLLFLISDITALTFVQRRHQGGQFTVQRAGAGTLYQPEGGRN